MAIDGLEKPQEFRVARAIDAWWPEDDELGAALAPHFLLGGKFASAVSGNRMRRIAFADGRAGYGRPGSRQAGSVNKPLSAARLGIQRVQQVARPGLI